MFNFVLDKNAWAVAALTGTLACSAPLPASAFSLFGANAPIQTRPMDAGGNVFDYYGKARSANGPSRPHNYHRRLCVSLHDETWHPKRLRRARRDAFVPPGQLQWLSLGTRDSHHALRLSAADPAMGPSHWRIEQLCFNCAVWARGDRHGRSCMLNASFPVDPI